MHGRQVRTPDSWPLAPADLTCPRSSLKTAALDVSISNLRQEVLQAAKNEAVLECMQRQALKLCEAVNTTLHGNPEHVQSIL